MRAKTEMASTEEILANHRSERVKCEIYSRVVGYLRPVSQWNEGKKEEFKDRKTYERTREAYS